jgi:hypothetical protein
MIKICLIKLLSITEKGKTMNKIFQKTQNNIYAFFIIFIVSILSLKTGADINEKKTSVMNTSKIFKEISKTQIPFIINEGQLDKSVRYYTHTLAGPVYVTNNCEIIYSLSHKSDNGMIDGLVVKEKFGDKAGVKISGENLTATKINYFKGNDKSSWKKNLKTYNRLSLGDIKDGISMDLNAYGNNIEKIFTIQPGADVRDIKVSISGINEMEVNSNGELTLKSTAGNISFTKPLAYQEISGNRKYVDVAYTLNESEYSFDVGDYNRDLPLFIDPLLASTLLGGWCDEISYGPFIELDDTGNVYISGFTCTTNFPTSVGAFQGNYGGGQLDCFVAKFNNDLTSLVACTFLGGSGFETECSMTLDNDGNIFAGGYTDSQNFPTTPGAYNETNNGAYDIFISKLSNDLSTLISSTYIGGSSNDGFESNRINLMVGQNGDLYVAGQSRSDDFPTTTGAYDTTFNGAGPYEQSGDAVVFRMDNTLSTLIASTYLGGSSDEFRVSIAQDENENIFVSTATYSSNIPIIPGGGYDEIFNGLTDVFISKLSNDLTTQLAATYLGGGSGEIPLVIEAGENNNIYLCGFTSSSNYPTIPGVYDEIYNGGGDDGFISKFDNNLTTLLASTFLGGSAADGGQDLVLYKGEIYITGKTLSSNFPIISGTYDDTYNGGTEHGDMFVSKMDSNLTTLFASTFLGGTDDEKPFGIEVDTSGNVFVGGFTHSSDYPTTAGAYDRTFGGIRDVVVAKFNLTPMVGVAEDVITPIEFELYQNYPNPFNPTTTIRFTIPQDVRRETQDVKLILYDVLGYEITTLVNEEKPAGEYIVEFDATALSSGIYFYRIQTGSFIQTKKMILMK